MMSNSLTENDNFIFLYAVTYRIQAFYTLVDFLKTNIFSLIS